MQVLALPGFGVPVPAHFGSTKEEYVEWLIRRLESEPEPVDLVGHDWGCILVARVISLRPDLVRSWAAGGGPVSASYTWHPLAKLWQTPGAGETWMSDLDADRMAEDLESHGVPPARARETASRMDPALKSSILALYRSAADVGKEWQPGLAAVRSPGLVIWGERDVPCPVSFADELARDTGAELLRLPSGHWTPLEVPEVLAAELERHWASVGAAG